MPLVKLSKDPSARDLRWFGALFAVFFGLAGFLSWRKTGMDGAAPFFWIPGVVVPVAYYAIRPLRRPIYVGWIYLVSPIGFVVSYAVLGFAYFVVFTPVGLLMRLLGKDPMQRRFEPSRATYWSEHRTGADRSSYFRQF